MKKISLFLMFSLFAALACADNFDAPKCASSKPLRPFAPGEKVAFIGDSITHSCRWIAWLKYIVNTRNADLPEVEFMNFGIAGDSGWNVKHRLDWDVLPNRFDRAFVMLGMNDCPAFIWGSENPTEAEKRRRNSRVASYLRYMTNIISRLEKSGVEVVLATPSPFDEYSIDLKAENFPGRNERGLAAYAEAIRSLAAERGLCVVDFHKPMTSALKQSPGLKLCGPDRIHPLQNGSVCMAALVAEAMGMTEGPGGRFCVDASDNKDAKVVRLPDGGVKFSYSSGILPFPVNSISSFADLERSIKPVGKLKSEFLSIGNLPAGKWVLKADGRAVGTFSETELADGIDMSHFDTPSQRAAARAKKAMEVWRDKTSLVRDIAMTRQILRMQKADPYDVEKAKPILEKWLKTGQGKGRDDYFGPIFAKFERMSKFESELRKSAEDAGKEFFALCKGVSYEVTLERPPVEVK